MSESIEEKQQYLHDEIIAQNYDGNEFTEYICSIRGEERDNIDLDKWSLEELKSIVQQFKSQHMQKPNEVEEAPEENHEQNEVHEEVPEKLKENQENEAKPEPQVQENAQNENKDDAPNEEEKKEEPKLESKTSSGNDFPNEFLESFTYNIKTEQMQTNEITDQNDLYVTVSNPVRVKPGVFALPYFQYDVVTKPIGYKVVRKLADFLFLNEIMPLYNNVVFNPPLPHFEFGLKDDSGKKMLYLQNYINSLIENKFFRTLPIFYEFLSLPQVKWNNKRNELAKMKQLPLTRMPFLEGELNININKEEDAKAFKIKDEINKKAEALDGVNSTMDKILEIFDNLKYQFEMLAKFLLDLEKAYQSNQELKGFFNRLKLLSKRWSKDYLKQKIVFRDEFKYYFKFINKDNVSFLKKFEEYRVARDDYKSKFEKVKKMQVRQTKDIELVKKLRNDYGLQLLIVNKEYNYLLERQAHRCMTQFMKYHEYQKSILQGYENCKTLFNINQDINNLEDPDEDKNQNQEKDGKK